MKRKGLNWTEEDLARHQARMAGGPVLPDQLLAKPQRQAQLAPDFNGIPTPRLVAPHAPANAGMDAFYALGRLAKGRMNKTEAEYAQLLEAKKYLGEIIDYRFHAIRVRLADRTFYEPDFLVMMASREIQIHETKGGFTTKEGQTKIKLCAEVLPWFRVFKCALGPSGWDIQEFTKR